MNLGPMEISLILLAVLVLFGYKKLPDASRSLGRSLRIFKSEMKGMKADEAGGVVPGEVLAPAVVDLEAEAGAVEPTAASRIRR